MKIGYACKTSAVDHWTERDLNFKSVKLGYLEGLNDDQRWAHLDVVVNHNLGALRRVIELHGNKPVELRMFRIGSELLPLWDHPIAASYYRNVAETISHCLLYIGAMARRFGVRLSFHPSQFVVIASPSPGVAERGRYTIEKMASIGAMMGYEGWHPQGFSINIHAGSGQNSIADIRSGIQSLSLNARNFLTLENDEFSWGLDDLLDLKDIVAIVPDLHHYWVREHSYLSHEDRLVAEVIESWRGVRPKLHLAMSRQHLLEEHCHPGDFPSMTNLLNAGLNKSKLRAHSDSPWNTAILDYARPFSDNFDIMWEGKDKDAGQFIIAEYFSNPTI